MLERRRLQERQAIYSRQGERVRPERHVSQYEAGSGGAQVERQAKTATSKEGGPGSKRQAGQEGRYQEGS